MIKGIRGKNYCINSDCPTRVEGRKKAEEKKKASPKKSPSKTKAKGKSNE